MKMTWENPKHWLLPKKLKSINSEIEVEALVADLNHTNIQEILNDFNFLAAASALGSPTSFSSKSICLWRLLSSTKSLSIMVIWPTPARARLLAATVPNAPQPTITALLFNNFFGLLHLYWIK